ncbi:hypothetical protein H5410_041744 [Solanum commersonii]|uniref:Uncharacterized protein n=1 Tax=Solanum commersonii TaxID=4109 RepID=A0A9J5XWG0_SOLCO|nr:hypothetical protein H5410_041744 [Solanum commersonii]
MYPNRRGGFEFMWNNIAGDINLERLKEPLSESKGGCIISPPPSTRKTRLNIVFLQSILKMFPQCRPEAEFQKWAVDITFHNLNNKDFSLKEDEGIVGVFHHLSNSAKKNSHLMHMVKLKYWVKSKSVLVISYDLFRILTRENGEGYAKETREILLKFPGMLFLEEGHTARNEHNLVWKALKKNSIKEMYNTLCVVSPKFATDLEQKWASLGSSIDKNKKCKECKPSNARKAKLYKVSEKSIRFSVSTFLSACHRRLCSFRAMCPSSRTIRPDNFRRISPISLALSSPSSPMRPANKNSNFSRIFFQFFQRASVEDSNSNLEYEVVSVYSLDLFIVLHMLDLEETISFVAFNIRAAFSSMIKTSYHSHFLPPSH